MDNKLPETVAALLLKLAIALPAEVYPLDASEARELIAELAADVTEPKPLVPEERAEPTAPVAVVKTPLTSLATLLRTSD